MADDINTTASEVKESVNSIYSRLLKQRREKREAKEEKKRVEKEDKKAEKLEREFNEKENRPMTKKEKAAASFDAWKEIVVGLTGDDIEYIKPKVNKRKFKKWIGDEDENNVLMAAKPKKKKKRNYNKEFEPELNMLKSIVADQNKFVTDLQKRYQMAAGPNTKDANPLNKTIVDLAAVVNNSRGNSLGLLREIGNIKKTIADLYMKQQKQDWDMGKSGMSDMSDLGVRGSDIAIKEILGSDVSYTGTSATSDVNNSSYNNESSVNISEFDPSSWSGVANVNDNTKFENISKTIVVEWNKSEGLSRFKAIGTDGSEIIGCPVPKCKIKSFNENNQTASDDFDQVYPLEIIGESA